MNNIAIEIVHFTFVIVLLAFPQRYHAGGIAGVELSMAPSHVALSGDFHVRIASTSFPPLLFQVSRLEGNVAQPLYTFPVYPQAEALKNNRTMVTIPCGFFAKGGIYYILVKKQPIEEGGKSAGAEEVITQSLDVRWPMPQLTVTPEHVQTYPERPVDAILEFPDVVCPPRSENPVAAIPEFWLELHYCGHSLLTCDDEGHNKSKQVLYSEQVRGFPGKRLFTLRCELFGLAGHYALFLRPTAPAQPLPHTAAYIKADWSDQFVFNVHARSIFPCDVHNGGITVLFQYPSCILATGDRVRLFARLRANVASLAPPTSLEYVAEQRVVRGQHSLHFDCDLFTERYVEYCFVYVSQAINGAVADVRMDCVPTLPATENESGGWGPWSSWTPCSSTCIGGTRTRYRFCDSPPPRYGAKFCEVRVLEQNLHAHQCKEIGLRTELEDLRTTNTRLYDVLEDAVVAINEALELKTKVKDKSVAASRRENLLTNLLLLLSEARVHKPPHPSIETVASASFAYECGDLGFIPKPARRATIQTNRTVELQTGSSFEEFLQQQIETSSFQTVKESEGQAVETEKCGKGIGSSWECFYGGVAIADITAEIPEIQAEVGPYCRCGCVVHLGQAKPKRLLATSSQSCPGRTFWLIQADDNFTIRFKVEQFHLPCGTQWLKIRDGSSLSATLVADLSGNPNSPEIVNSTGPNLLLEFYSDDVHVGAEMCGGGFLAHASQIRSRRRNVTAIIPIAQSISVVPDLILKLTAVHIAAIFFLSGLLIATVLLGAQYLFRYRKYHVAHADDRDSLTDGNNSASSSLMALPTTRASSNATLLSEVISLKKLRTKSGGNKKQQNGCSKHARLRESMDCEDIATLAKEETMSVCSTVTLTEKETLVRSDEIKTLPNSPEKSEKEDELSGPGCHGKPLFPRRLSNVSAAALTHVRPSAQSENASKSDPGFYSPATSSLASTATIRSTNVKETKEKRNRAKLLAGPTSGGGSDFSIVGAADLEMDYYDYNVVNAGAAPGSYLGMDPAFLVWIPPLDEDGSILQEERELDDIKPKVYIDPGSNKESPEEEMLLPKEHRVKRVIRIMEKQPLLEKIRKNAEDDEEKETKVEKCSILGAQDDIKFADEEDDESNECNTIELSYQQDSNILASS